MLANKAKLGVKTSDSASTYTDLPGLKSLAELGAEPELVDNTCLTDTMMQYEQGIGDPGTLEYTFKLDNSSETTAYRILRALDKVKTYDWQETLVDGTTYTFKAQPSIRVGGGGVNEALEFTLSLALQSDITVTNPTQA
jgi:hypothetical protein